MEELTSITQILEYTQTCCKLFAHNDTSETGFADWYDIVLQIAEVV